MEDLELEKEGLVYRTEKWRMIVKFDDDHIPEFDINNWGYGKFHIYIPPSDEKEKIPYLVQKEIQEEIEKIKRLSKEFGCREN